MARSIFSKVMWVGRATVFVVGLSVILAVVLGGATMAFAANGKPWLLGRSNLATAITALGGKSGVNGPMVRLTNNNSGTDDTALDLRVQSGEPPMKVNSTTKVTSLNADQLDGKDVSQIGVNGLEVVRPPTFASSASPKSSTAPCPSGKVLVGTGANFIGGTSGASPDELTNVVIQKIEPDATSVTVQAIEEEPTNDSWSVEAIAICATAP